LERRVADSTEAPGPLRVACGPHSGSGSWEQNSRRSDGQKIIRAKVVLGGALSRRWSLLSPLSSCPKEISDPAVLS
jgi:hypothetical protein